MKPALENAARSLDRIIGSIGRTHVERADRARLAAALNELCSHRPELKRQAERVIMLAASCSVPMTTKDREETLDKLRQMVRALIQACLTA